MQMISRSRLSLFLALVALVIVLCLVAVGARFLPPKPIPPSASKTNEEFTTESMWKAYHTGSYDVFLMPPEQLRDLLLEMRKSGSELKLDEMKAILNSSGASRVRVKWSTVFAYFLARGLDTKAAQSPAVLRTGIEVSQCRNYSSSQYALDVQAMIDFYKKRSEEPSKEEKAKWLELDVTDSEFVLLLKAISCP